MKSAAFTLAIFAIMLPGTAQANCADPQNQAEINQCAGEEWQAADDELNMIYKKLVSRIDSVYEPELRKAQRAWVTFRDAECEFESMGWEGGSGRPGVQAGCLTRLTKERTSKLDEMLNCDPESYEGPMECPRKE